MVSSRRSLDDLEKRGVEIFNGLVTPVLKPDDHGKFVAIDVDSGDFEIDSDDLTAVTRLQWRHPSADIWLVRAGHDAAYRIGTMK